MPIQQMLLGVGSATKTYADDVFSTFLYKGNNSANTLNTGLDMSGEGGLLWVKSRSNRSHQWFDTVRGVNKHIHSDTTAAEVTTSAMNQTFTSTGFTFNNTYTDLNDINGNYASWSFRKAPGFFTIKEYTGSGSTQSLTHDLGSIPGCIMVKRTDSTANWGVYHRGQNGGVDPEDYRLRLNSSTTENNDTYWGDTAPTATHFTVGDAHTEVNLSGATYIAYLFAGGESTQSEAVSVDFDGSDDQLNIPDSADWDLGNGDFTLETWIKSTQTTSGYFTALGQWTTHTSPDYGWAIRYASQDIGTGWSFFYSTTGSNYITTMGSDISDGQWHHVAITRTGGKLRTFTDGTLNTTRSTTDTFNTSGATMKIGGQGTSGNYFDGQLSNVRLVKGTALYTSSFRRPTEPLTNVTNTKLLCCNNSSVTGSTVTPGTITASSSPTASTDSPFDDPAGFVFGEAGDQNVIKCGSHTGTANANEEMYLGWEPQYVLIKNANNANGYWDIFDSMRGIVTGGSDGDVFLAANANDSESDRGFLNLTSTGFILQESYPTGNNVIWIAIRRPDGYCGKPPELGTDVFTPIFNATDNAAPFYRAANHVVDFALAKRYDTIESWFSSSRLIQGKYLQTDTTSAEQSNSYQQFDYQSAYNSYPSDNVGDNIGYLWKRHAGFDVVCYEGNNVGGGRQIPHSLNKAPEMMWFKNRDSDPDWNVYHKGLDGGTNPEQKYLVLNTNAAEADNVNRWNDTAPTSTVFTIGDSGRVNSNTHNYIAMLFASVDGISKVGYYSGSSSAQTITTGFQPRFLIIRKADALSSWWVLDTTRGWSSGDDHYLGLNFNSADNDNFDFAEPISTGFTVSADNYETNKNGTNLIYYAHA